MPQLGEELARRADEANLLADEVIDDKKERVNGRGKGGKEPKRMVFDKDKSGRLLTKFLEKGGGIAGLDVMEVVSV
jgi:hypothetical protein